VVQERRNDFLSSLAGLAARRENACPIGRFNTRGEIVIVLHGVRPRFVTVIDVAKNRGARIG